jgi:hypothetical protein
MDTQRSDPARIRRVTNPSRRYHPVRITAVLAGGFGLVLASLGGSSNLFLLLTGGALCAGAFVLDQVMATRLDERQLRSGGTEAVAEVSRVRNEGSNFGGWTVWFRFLADGTPHEGSFKCHGQRQSVTPGDHIDILFDRDQPDLVGWLA